MRYSLGLQKYWIAKSNKLTANVKEGKIDPTINGAGRGESRDQGIPHPAHLDAPIAGCNPCVDK